MNELEHGADHNKSQDNNSERGGKKVVGKYSKNNPFIYKSLKNM